jgi:hypothetical protein
MQWWKAILPALAYAAVAPILLFGVLWFSRYFGAAEPPMTLIAALGGALVASLAPVITATLSSLGQERDRTERIRDEASRVAIELTKMDYDVSARWRTVRPSRCSQRLRCIENSTEPWSSCAPRGHGPRP